MYALCIPPGSIYSCPGNDRLKKKIRDDRAKTITGLIIV